MKKNLKWLIAVGVAGLLVMAIAIPAMAANPKSANNDTPASIEQPAYGNCHGQGIGVGINQAIVDLLGMTREQIQEKRQAGNSLVQIAAEKGITEEQLIDTIMAARQTALQEMVAAGTITQEQADLKLAKMQERVQLAINRTTIGPPDWAGANGNGQNGNGTGSMRQNGLRGNQENCTGTPGTCTGTGNMMRVGRNAR